MADVKAPGDARAAFWVAIALTIVAALIDNGAVGWLIGPVVFLLLVYAMTKVPLRTSLLVMMFCAFTLENPAEQPADGQWKSPLFNVGALLLTHFNNTTHISWQFFSGMDLLIWSLFFIALQRRMSGSRIDKLDQIPTPRPLVKLAYVSLLGTLYVFLNGFLRGGDVSFSLWQIDRVMYLPMLFLLFHLGLRGPADVGKLAKVLLTAATIRACLAVYIINTVVLPPDPNTGDTKLPYATSHHDSILFATAAVALVAILMYRVNRRAMRFAYVLIPILGWGMVSNGRRMVWVQVLLVLVTLYFATPMNAAKRKMRKLALVLTPVGLLYTLVGWSSQASAFKPVQMLRSVVDAERDASTLSREIENYDLIYTLKQYPILGMGYGHPYWEIVPVPPMPYTLEKYCPHNSILGLWCYSGYIGYTAMTALWVAGVYFGMRAYYAAQKPIERAAGLVSFGVVLIYLIQCFGDMGLGSWIGVYTMAPALAIAGKLAVATGAWSVGRKSAHPAAVAAVPQKSSSRAPAPAAAQSRAAS